MDPDGSSTVWCFGRRAALLSPNRTLYFMCPRNPNNPAGRGAPYEVCYTAPYLYFAGYCRIRDRRKVYGAFSWAQARSGLPYNTKYFLLLHIPTCHTFYTGTCPLLQEACFEELASLCCLGRIVPADCDPSAWKFSPSSMCRGPGFLESRCHLPEKQHKHF